MTKKMTNVEALTLLAEKTVESTKAIKSLTEVIGQLSNKPITETNQTAQIKDGVWWVENVNTGIPVMSDKSVVCFDVIIGMGEVREEDRVKFEQGDIVQDGNQVEASVDVGKAYAGWKTKDGKTVSEEGILTFSGYESSALKVELWNYQPIQAKAYKNTRIVDWKKIVKITDVTFTREGNILRDFMISGELENGRSISRLINSDYEGMQLRLMKTDENEEYESIDSSYPAESNLRIWVNGDETQAPDVLDLEKVAENIGGIPKKMEIGIALYNGEYKAFTFNL